MMNAMDELLKEIDGQIDKSGKEPLYSQIAAAVRRASESGLIGAGGKLPPIRKLASALGVNNITVINAYKLLENERFARSVTGSGTYVSGGAEDDAAQNAAVPAFMREKARNYSEDSAGMINFARGSVSPELFPVEEFKQMFNRVLSRDKGNAFGYEQSQGYPALRDSLCGYLESFGIKTTGDKIQIISGAQQGVDVIAKALLRPNDCAITENPTYYGAVGAFLSRGASVYGADMEEDGINITRLETLVKLHKPKLLYVMTYFQTPTCYCYSIEKKRALIELAVKYDFFIIEEDNQSDFTYAPDFRAVPLKALDYKNRVIYIKSFSKLLMPGLRLGFMALPKPVLTAALNAKYTSDIDTSGFLQRAFDLFIQTGGWDRHIQKMRSVFKTRYEIFTPAAKRLLAPYLTFREPRGGLNVWFDINIDKTSAELAEIAADGGVAITPGEIFALGDKTVKNVRLSFADVETGGEKGIIAGIEKLGGILRGISET